MAFEAMNGAAGPGELLGGVLAGDGGDSKCDTSNAEDSPTLVRLRVLHGLKAAGHE
jgi:hypothetical protein